jgi:Ca-dependent carbohydrate-binding module xylan-binding/Right handed beta helix region
MAYVAHSDWMFEHSPVHHFDTPIDPHSEIVPDASPLTHTDSVASVLKTLWHHTDLMSGGSSSALASSGAGNANGSTKSTAPTLTVGSNALTVDAGGSVALPISVTPSGGHAASVTIAGLASYEAVTDNLDHKVFTGDSITLSAAEVNSGLSLASNYTGTGHPVNTLTMTASETIGNHTLTSASQAIQVTDPPTTTTTSGTGNGLTLQVSGDMLNGTDPRIQVFVDGQQIGGTYDITAHHSLGQTQTIQIAGNFDPTVAHQVQVKFINDAWDGTAYWTTGASPDGHDINAYVESIALNGTTIAGSQGTDAAINGHTPTVNANEAVMNVDGTLSFNVPAGPPATSSSGSGTGGTGTTGSTSNGLTLQVSGDMLNGTDPRIQVFVDGQQIGGTYDITAHHSLGQTQTIQIAGNFDPTVAHQVQVKFINDAWDGTAYWTTGASPDGHDINAYVESIALNGTTIAGSQGTDAAINGHTPTVNANEAVMNVDGTLSFNVPADPPATSSGTGTGGTGTTGAGAGTTPSGSGFYVSPTGNDSNPGTLAAPFATLARAQQAMENSSIKATYVEGGTYHLSSSLTLTAADNGETWQYYPPDGVNSAVLDGGNSINLIYLNGSSNITIDGLKLQNASSNAIVTQDGPGAAQITGITIENCDIGFNQHTGDSGGFNPLVLIENATNTHILNNYVHDAASQGIGLYAFYAGQSIDGSVVSGNVVLHTVQQMSDGGAIYVNMRGTGDSGGHVTISNNFVRDYGAAGITGAAGIYLDDNSSNVTVTGNVVAPATEGAVSTGNLGATAFEIHDGNNNTIFGNIADLGDSGRAFAAVWYQDSASAAGMGNDTFTGNVVISNFAGSQSTNFTGQTGYTYFENSAGSNFAIAGNAYFNYGGGQVRTDGQSASDSNPIMANPQISGSAYQIANGSPVFSAPMSFSNIVVGWGPSGFVIPQSGTILSA